MPSGSRSGGASAGAGPGAAIGQAIGAGIVEALRQGEAQKKARAEALKLEQLRLAEIQRQEEAARKAQFEREKGALLDKMGGGGPQLGLKDDEPEPAEPDMGLVRDLHNRESAERREALERLRGKPEELWCKLHLPQALLMPEPPVHDAAERYPDMMSSFTRKRSEWDRRCGGPSSEGATEFDTAVSLLTVRASAAPALLERQTPVPATGAAAPAGKLSLKDDDDDGDFPPPPAGADQDAFALPR